MKRKLRYTLAGVVISIFSLTLISCSKEPRLEYVPLPVLTKPVKLRVASIVNSRFPQLTTLQIQKILEQTVLMVKENFEVDIIFEKPQTDTIENFFTYLKSNVKEERLKEIVNLSTLSPADKDKMHSSILRTLEIYENDQQVVIDYARPYLLKELQTDNFSHLATALVDTLLSRLQYWQEKKAKDGKPVINGDPFNEWVWWDSIGYDDMPYDVVITNQLVASAEYYGMDVHSSIRGGITAGTTTFSRDSKYGTFAFISVYQMLNDSPMLARLREDRHYEQDQITQYSAALLTHELGHLLLHLGHPFGNKNCVMSPTPLLKYRQWIEGLDASSCRLKSEQQMVPGAVKLDYRTDWL